MEQPTQYHINNMTFLYRVAVWRELFSWKKIFLIVKKNISFHEKNIFLHENNSSEMTFYTVEVLFHGI